MTNLTIPTWKGFGFQIQNDLVLSNINTTNSDILPFLNAANPLPSKTAGAIAYEPSSELIYYNNGKAWLPVGSGSGSSLESYSFVSSGDQGIAPLTPTMVSGWTASTIPVYHTIPQWNLITGIYTATASPEYLYMDADITWKGGISNLGVRTLTIKYRQFSTSVVYTVRTVQSQADTSTNVATTQEVSLSLMLEIGDQVWVEVSHTAPTPLVIAGGASTNISGYRLPP